MRAHCESLRVINAPMISVWLLSSVLSDVCVFLSGDYVVTIDVSQYGISSR